MTTAKRRLNALHLSLGTFKNNAYKQHPDVWITVTASRPNASYNDIKIYSQLSECFSDKKDGSLNRKTDTARQTDIKKKIQRDKGTKFGSTSGQVGTRLRPFWLFSSNR